MFVYFLIMGSQCG